MELNNVSQTSSLNFSSLRLCGSASLRFKILIRIGKWHKK
jgi:hypothetical protein